MSQFNETIRFHPFLSLLAIIFCFALLIKVDCHLYEMNHLFLLILFSLVDLYFIYSITVGSTYKIVLSPEKLEEYLLFKKISDLSVDQIIGLKRSAFHPIIGAFVGWGGSGYLVHRVDTLKIESKTKFYPRSKVFFYVPTVLENLHRREDWKKNERSSWIPLFRVNMNKLVSYIFRLKPGIYVDADLTKRLSYRTRKEIDKKYFTNSLK